MSQGDKEELAAWKVAPLPELIRHLVGTCHLECREDMARLETQVELAALNGGRKNRAFLEVRDLIGLFCRDMRAHLALEERNLFPHLLARDEGDGAGSDLESMRKLLEGDHEAEASLLRRIRTLSGTLVELAPEAQSQVRIHDTIKILSERLQKHLYLESQILFPRSL